MARWVIGIKQNYGIIRENIGRILRFPLEFPLDYPTSK